MAETFRTQKYNADYMIESNRLSGTLSDDDAEILRNYISYLTVTRSHNSYTQAGIVCQLCTLQKLSPIVSIRDLTAETIFAKIRTLHESDYKQNTKFLMLAKGKAFWKYLIKKGIISADYTEIKKIRGYKINRDTTAPDEILTPEEIQALISHAGNARNRAIIAVLYESACRISELARLRWRDVIFDKYGAKIYIADNKTHKIRYNRLIISVQHLLEWKNDYELFGSAKGDNLVFVSQRGNQLSYIGYHLLLKKVAAAAGINKRVHLHLFRKSRITHMVKENYQESVIKKVAWGNLNTNQLETYIRLSEEDIDGECLDHHPGLAEKKVEETSVLRSSKCVRCGALLSPDQHYCGRCGLPTDPNESEDDSMCIDPELIARVLKILQSQEQ